jgi:methylated-DNA-[protein]-cysteine S-methyltransferase
MTTNTFSGRRMQSPATAGPVAVPGAGRRHTVVASPIGEITLVVTGDDLTGLYLIGQRHRPAQETFGRPGDPADEPFAATIAQLGEYFAGRRTRFDLPIAFHGTAFQRMIWTALREIPFGETVSYGELAELIGKPTAARAVGLANGKNPVGIIVPCHRVIGASGSLTGYGGGLENKQWLLDLERALPRVHHRF